MRCQVGIAKPSIGTIRSTAAWPPKGLVGRTLLKTTRGRNRRTGGKIFPSRPTACIFPPTARTRQLPYSRSPVPCRRVRSVSGADSPPVIPSMASGVMSLRISSPPSELPTAVGDDIPGIYFVCFLCGARRADRQAGANKSEVSHERVRRRPHTHTHTSQQASNRHTLRMLYTLPTPKDSVLAPWDVRASTVVLRYPRISGAGFVVVPGARWTPHKQGGQIGGDFRCTVVGTACLPAAGY